MKNKIVIESLTEPQKVILIKFINYFFNRTNTKRNYRTNEIEFIFYVFRRIFKNNFNFIPNKIDIINAFKESGFKIYKKSGGFKDKKLEITHGKIEEVENILIYSIIKEDSYFVEISPIVVKALNRIYKNNSNLKNEKILQEVEVYEKNFTLFLLSLSKNT